MKIISFGGGSVRMRKRMAILVIGIGAVLSSRESGQSFSKEMGAESLPKRLEGGVGAKRGNRCARGIGSRRKKENDNGSEGLRGGGNVSGGSHAPKAGIDGISRWTGLSLSAEVAEMEPARGRKFTSCACFIKWKVAGRRSFAGCRLNG